MPFESPTTTIAIDLRLAPACACAVWLATRPPTYAHARSAFVASRTSIHIGPCTHLFSHVSPFAPWFQILSSDLQDGGRLPPIISTNTAMLVRHIVEMSYPRSGATVHRNRTPPRVKLSRPQKRRHRETTSAIDVKSNLTADDGQRWRNPNRPNGKFRLDAQGGERGSGRWTDEVRDTHRVRAVAVQGATTCVCILLSSRF